MIKLLTIGWKWLTGIIVILGFAISLVVNWDFLKTKLAAFTYGAFTEEIHEIISKIPDSANSLDQSILNTIKLFEEKVKRKTQEVSQLRADLKDALKQIEKMEEQVNSSKRSLKNAEKKISHFQKEIRQKELELEDLEQEIDRFKDRDPRQGENDLKSTKRIPCEESPLANSFDEFCVQVFKLTLSSKDPRKIIVDLEFRNKTKDTLFLAINPRQSTPGSLEGSPTSLMDTNGELFRLNSARGIRGLHSPNYNPPPMRLERNGRAFVSLIFQVNFGQDATSPFTLNSEIAILSQDRTTKKKNRAKLQRNYLVPENIQTILVPTISEF